MAVHFSRRTPIMLKNRYYAHIRKRDLYDSLKNKLEELEREGKSLQEKYESELDGAFEVAAALEEKSSKKVAKVTKKSIAKKKRTNGVEEK